jgi:hypothetical protein
MTPLLPLDIWRQELGLHPWHFWGLADSGANAVMPINSKCSGLVLEYSWQGSDAAGRDDLRRAIERAEEKLLTYLQYRVAPQYVVSDALPWPRFNDPSMIRFSNIDTTGRRVAMQAPEGYIQALGVEQLTLIGTATTGVGGGLVYSDVLGTGFNDTFTITLPTTVTDPAQIAVYFAAADRFDDLATGDRWRIQPIQVSISGGNVVIVGRRWLVVRPILYQAPVLNAINPTNAANFVTSLEVYQRTTNEAGNTVDTSQATLIYETSDCGGWGACCCSSSGSTDPGTVGLVIARAGIRDKVLGLVTPAAAVLSNGVWSSAGCNSCYAEPDRVRLRYLAGASLENGQMARRWQQAVAMLAAAELKRRICACRETNERLHDLQIDLTLESTTTERYQHGGADLDNPFGTRLGHVQAWRLSKDHILRRGMLA